MEKKNKKPTIYDVAKHAGVSITTVSRMLNDPNKVNPETRKKVLASIDALGAFQGHYATDIPLLCAGTILILLPTLIIFILFQRQIIAALLQGSVKG